jgi:CheY-like chemotaxis protein
VKKVGTRTEPSFMAVRARAQAPAKPLLLYVEDDDDNWAVARMRLTDRYDITRASNAREACDILARRGPEFTAILMDIELQGSEINGIQLTEFLRGASRATAPSYLAGVPVLHATTIIFVTAHGAAFEGGQLEKAGGDRVIGKPVDFKALNLAITQTHLDRVMAKRRAP